MPESHTGIADRSPPPSCGATKIKRIAVRKSTAGMAPRSDHACR
jgi:hypothetical protein